MDEANPQVVSVVLARRSSKTEPRKNLRVLEDKTLLGRSIETAKEIAGKDRVFEFTKSETIANEGCACGAQVIHRDASLTAEESPEWLSWKHAITEVRGLMNDFEISVSIPTTGPLRAVSDCGARTNVLDGSADCVATMALASHGPAFKMVGKDRSDLIRLGAEETGFGSRKKDTPEMLDLTAVAYGGYHEFVLTQNSLWDGRFREVFFSTRASFRHRHGVGSACSRLFLPERDNNG